MKLNILSALGLFATSVVLTGCYEDKGNYDYTEIEELTITLPSAIEAMANAENIQFSPTIVSSITGKEISPDDPNYEYECRVYYTRTIDGISEKWYDINPDKTMAVDFFVEAPAGTYTLWYTARNKRTGVESHAKGSIRLISSVYEGWMVMANCGAEKTMRLDMIFTDSKGRELIAKNITGTKVTGLTEGTQAMYFPSMYAGKECVNILTKSGSYRVWDDMQILASSNLKLLDFVMPTTEGSPTKISQIIYYGSYGPTATTCVTDIGDAYAITSAGAGASYEYPLNAEKVGDKPSYKVAQAIGTSMVRQGNSSSALFYDITNKRFMGWSYYASNNKLLFPLNDNDENQPQGLFSFNTGMDFVDMESTRFSNGLVYTVLQDNTGHRHVYGINLSGYNSIKKESAYDNITGENFDTATDYAFHSQFPYMFYCKGNKVYSYGLVDNSIKDVLTLDGAETTTLLKFNLYGNMTLTSLNKWEDEEFQSMQYKLIVCSTTGGEDGGIVRFYNVDTAGKMSLYKEYKGFGENIVDVTYRERRK